MKKQILGSAIVAALGSVSTSANAALASDALLEFVPGVQTCAAFCSNSPNDPYYPPILVVSSGSYFGMDTNGNGSVAPAERTPIAMNTGVALGTTQGAGAIDQNWSFFGSLGTDYTTVATTVTNTGTNTATADFSGWTVTWNKIPAIPMGAGAWQGNAEGTADITCAVDCAVGDTYELNYSGTVPANDPSGFQFVKYNLKLVGTVSAVPVPAAVWLFGSGLLGLVGIARRRKVA